jgi:hypothetical protein
MAHREKSRNPLRRAVRAVKGAITRHRVKKTVEPVAHIKAAARVAEQPHARPIRRQTDIPMDVLASAYSPTQTSLKAPFRDDGSDHHRDQEYGRGPESDRWRDEDRFTNKSGDPRIGTHGRTYEPNEDRISTTEGESEWTRTRP